MTARPKNVPVAAREFAPEKNTQKNLLGAKVASKLGTVVSEQREAEFNQQN